MDLELGNQNGNSKERRDQLKKETEKLAKDLPFKFEKTSQLRILKAICTYIKKEKHFNQFKKMEKIQNLNNLLISYNDEYVVQIRPGFITCFTKNGDLVYLSENIADYFPFNAMDVLFAYDNVLEIVCKQDVDVYNNLFKNYQQYAGNQNRFSFYTSWYVSKIQKKQIVINEYKQFKICGHYDPLTELFIASCEPILSMNNRDTLTTTNPCCFRTTHKLNLQILECTQNFYECLGYDTAACNDLQDKFNFYNLWSPDSIETIVKRHRDLLVIKNTRGYIDRVKLISKDGGYIDCLLNIFYDPKGFIVCIHQMFNKSDMDNYVSYMNELNGNHKDSKEMMIKNEIIQLNDDESQIDINEIQNSNYFASGLESSLETSFEKSLNSQEQFSTIKIENSFDNDLLESSQANFGSIKRNYDYTSANDDHYDQDDGNDYHFCKKIKYTNDALVKATEENEPNNDSMFIPNDLKDIQIFCIEQSLRQTICQNQSSTCQLSKYNVEYPRCVVLDDNSDDDAFNFENNYLYYQQQQLVRNGSLDEAFDLEDKILPSCEFENFKKFEYLVNEYSDESYDKSLILEKNNANINDSNDHQTFYSPNYSFY